MVWRHRGRQHTQAFRTFAEAREAKGNRDAGDRRSIEGHALARWGSWRLADVEPADVRALFSALRDNGASTSAVKGLRAALSAMFATAVEDRLLRSNPVHGVRIPASAAGEPAEERRRR